MDIFLKFCEVFLNFGEYFLRNFGMFYFFFKILVNFGWIEGLLICKFCDVMCRYNKISRWV